MEEWKVKEKSLAKGISEYRSAAEAMESVKVVIGSALERDEFYGPILKDLEELRERVEELQAKFRRAMLWRRKELTKLQAERHRGERRREGTGCGCDDIATDGTR